MKVYEMLGNINNKRNYSGCQVHGSSLPAPIVSGQAGFTVGSFFFIFLEPVESRSALSSRPKGL